MGQAQRVKEDEIRAGNQFKRMVKWGQELHTNLKGSRRRGVRGERWGKRQQLRACDRRRMERGRQEDGAWRKIDKVQKKQLDEKWKESLGQGGRGPEGVNGEIRRCWSRRERKTKEGERGNWVLTMVRVTRCPGLTVRGDSGSVSESVSCCYR